MRHERSTEGRGLYRWRSFTPLLVLMPILGVTAWSSAGADTPPDDTAWRALGLVLGSLGLIVRALAIGYAPPGTSGRATRVVRADVLTTDGVYGIVRHPMYAGNALLWLGVASFSAQPGVLAFALLSFPLLHRPVVAAEERHLSARFGPAFDAWAEHTPRFVPRTLAWRPPDRDFDVRRVLGRDPHALFAFVAASWSVGAVRLRASTGAWPTGFGAWSYLGLGLGIFVALRSWDRHAKRRRGRLTRGPP